MLQCMCGVRRKPKANDSHSLCGKKEPPCMMRVVAIDEQNAIVASPVSAH